MLQNALRRAMRRVSRAVTSIWHRILRLLRVAPAPLTALHRGTIEAVRFRQRQEQFVERFGSLQTLVRLAFDREPPSDAADLMVFSLGRRIACDFDDVLLLSTERR